MRRANDLEIRVAVGSPSGTQSCILRVWSRRGESDVHAAVREMGSHFGVTLHEGGRCHAALTSESPTAAPALIEALGGPQRQNDWTRRTHLGSQQEVPLICAFPTSELTRWRVQPVTAPSLRWVAPPPDGGVTAIACIFTGAHLAAASWPGKQEDDRLLGQKHLPNGEMFWVVAYVTTEHRRVDKVIAHARRQAETARARVPATSAQRAPESRRMIAFDFHTGDRTLLMIDAAL